jgi:pyruvate/2-oxoglutarate dehydrogenase complex dihydrolipoamide dehydrogenase (E3) component
VLERSDRIGGQLALAGRARAHAETAATLAANYERLLGDDVELRLGVEATVDAVMELEPAAVVVATGARPYRPDLETGGAEVLDAWDVLAGALPAAPDLAIADWGGDPSGLAAAEMLVAAGRRVTLVSAALVPGESLHQYQRTLYLARLYAAGVVFEHHAEVVRAGPGTVTVRNVFATDVERELTAGALVVALGRVPEDTLAAELRGAGLRVEEAGDCRSPRGLEEAILEGTLAARAVLA